MNRKLATSLLTVALLSLPLAANAADTPGQIVKDSVITTKIKAAQASDPLVSAMKINVETDHSGKVVLSGNAKNQAEVDRAVQLARGIEGVSSVQNNMRVAGGGVGDPARMSDSAISRSGNNSAAPAPKAARN